MSFLMQLRRRLTRYRAIRQGPTIMEEAIEMEEVMTFAGQPGGIMRRPSPMDPLISVPLLDSGEMEEITEDPSKPPYWKRVAERMLDDEFSGGVYDFFPTTQEQSFLDMSFMPEKDANQSVLGGSILGGKSGGDESLLPGGGPRQRRGDSSLLGGSVLGGSVRRSSGDTSLLGGSVLPGKKK